MRAPRPEFQLTRRQLLIAVEDHEWFRATNHFMSAQHQLIGHDITEEVEDVIEGAVDAHIVACGYRNMSLEELVVVAKAMQIPLWRAPESYDERIASLAPIPVLRVGPVVHGPVVHDRRGGKH